MMAKLTSEQKRRIETQAQYFFGIVMGMVLVIIFDWSWHAVVVLAVLYTLVIVGRIIITKVWNGRKATVKMTRDELSVVYSDILGANTYGESNAILARKIKELDRKNKDV